jgi:hypothetical protein
MPATMDEITTFLKYECNEAILMGDSTWYGTRDCDHTAKEEMRVILCGFDRGKCTRDCSRQDSALSGTRGLGMVVGESKSALEKDSVDPIDYRRGPISKRG